MDGQRVRHGATFRLQMPGMPVLILGSPDAVRGLLLDRGKNFTSERGWGSNIGELFARGRDFRVPAATGASYRSRSGLKPRAATSTR